LAAAALVVALGGCGGPSADLFSVDRSGPDRNANLRVVVNDAGMVTCNGSIEKTLDAEDLLDARQLARDLGELAQFGIDLPPGPGAILRYRVDTESGPIAFSDTSRERPPAANRLVAFVKRIGEDVCGLKR
jgi:hypothetical protein